MENKSVLCGSINNKSWGDITVAKNSVDDFIIREKLSQMFLEPTKKNKKEYIGVEIEIPIVNLNKEAVDFDIVHKVTEEFKNHFTGFEVEGIDYDGKIYALRDPVSDDMVCYDCSYNNIEFAMGKEEELFSIHERFLTYYRFVKSRFEKYNHTLTGMGINPYRKYNKEIPISNERYLMLYHHLKSSSDYDEMMYFHRYPGYGMFSSASQVQLDVPYDELIENINVFSKLEPVKALLFSNSVLLGDEEDYACFRDLLWEHSTHGVNPHNIGMYDIEFEDITELISYLESLNIYCVMRDGIYISFHSMPLKEYFSRERIKGEYYSNGVYKTIEFEPSLDDIKYLRAFKFINLTFRGTLEYRSVCTQPIKDSMSVAAFHIGLKHKINELKDLFFYSPVYHDCYNISELRKLLIRTETTDLVDMEEFYNLTEKVLDLAREGLEERGFGEEVFIESLYENLRMRTNPGKRLLALLNNGMSLESIIKLYGDIE